MKRRDKKKRREDEWIGEERRAKEGRAKGRKVVDRRDHIPETLYLLA